jgi:hypothetical protein
MACLASASSVQHHETLLTTFQTLTLDVGVKHVILDLKVRLPCCYERLGTLHLG